MPIMTQSFKSFDNSSATGEPASYMVITREQFENLVNERLKTTVTYDLIIIGKQPWDTFPESVRKNIVDRVIRGTGLLYVSPPGADNDSTANLTDDPAARDMILAGIPLSSIPRLRNIPREKLLRTGVLGKGRVAILDYQEQFISPPDRYNSPESLTPALGDDIVFYDYYHSLLAKTCLWCAGRESEVSLTGLPDDLSIPRDKLPGTQLRIHINGRPPAGKLSARWVVRNQANSLDYEYTSELAGSDIILTFPRIPAGRKMLDVWLLSKNQTVTWMSTPLSITSPVTITGVALTKNFYTRNEPVTGHVTLSDTAGPGYEVVMEAEDSYGRKVASLRTKPINNTADFSLPVANPLAVAFTLRVRLEKSSEILDRAEVPFFINMTDFKELSGDFTFSIWAGVQPDSRSGKIYLDQFAASGADILYNTWSLYDDVQKTREAAQELAWSHLKMGLFASHVVLDWQHNPTVTGADGPEIKDCPLSLPLSEQSKTGRFVQLAKVAEGAAPIGPAYYDIGGESAISYTSTDVCFCRYCEDSFRRYLQNVYPDIKTLNAEWGTDYRDWSEVKPVTLKDAYRLNRYPQWMDHRLHMDRLFADFHSAMIGTIRGQDKTAQVGIHGPFYPSRSCAGFTFYRMLPGFHYFCLYTTDVSFIHETKAVQSFMPPESIVSGWFGCYQNQTNEGRMRYFPWHMLCIGGNSVSWWTGLVGEWLGGPAGFSPDYLPLRHLRQACEEIREIKSGVGKLLIASRRQAHPIGVYYSTSCLHASTFSMKETTWESSLSDIMTLLQDAAYDSLFVSPDDIRDGKLNDLKVLILPFSQAISIQESETMKEFVRRGGVLVADFSPGIMDEHGKMLERSSLAEVFGHFERLTVNQYGQGKGIYLGDYVKGYYQKRKDGNGKGICSGIVRLVEETSGVHPFARISNPDGSLRQDIETSLFRNGNSLYLILVRIPSDVSLTSEPDTFQVKLPASYTVYDTRMRKCLGLTDEFETILPAGRAKIYSLLPSPVRNVTLRMAKKEYERGDVVDYTASVSGENLAGCGLVMRIEVYAPDGSLLPHYCRNIAYDNTVCRGTIPLCLSEQKGTYRVLARDVASGLEKTATFGVR